MSAAVRYMYCCIVFFLFFLQARTSSTIFVVTNNYGELDIFSHICVQTNVGIFDVFELVGTLLVIFWSYKKLDIRLAVGTLPAALVATKNWVFLMRSQDIGSCFCGNDLIFLMFWGLMWCLRSCWSWQNTHIFDEKSGHLKPCFCANKGGFFTSSWNITGQNRVFYMRSQDIFSHICVVTKPGVFWGVVVISSCVWCDQNRYFKPKDDSFLTSILSGCSII